MLVTEALRPPNTYEVFRSTVHIDVHPG